MLTLPTTEFFKTEIKEFSRPWKIFSLFCGILLLIIGSYQIKALDWDIPISIIMATLTYIFAPISLRIIFERRWSLVPFSLFIAWFCVDGSYWLYWHFKNPRALALMREANFLASLSLFGLCGMIWLFHGSLKDFYFQIKINFSNLKDSSKTP